MRVYILAANYREAVEVARKRQLKPSGWVHLLQGNNLRGTRGATVLQTPCWLEHRTVTEWSDIRRHLEWSQANVVRIECP